MQEINQAMALGLPKDGTKRRLVPIYKEGNRAMQAATEIMVSNLFAKVLGTRNDTIMVSKQVSDNNSIP